jgi:hypothetical protein
LGVEYEIHQTWRFHILEYIFLSSAGEDIIGISTQSYNSVLKRQITAKVGVPSHVERRVNPFILSEPVCTAGC